MATNATIARNTPKGVNINGNSDIPSAYKVKKFICVNSDESRFDMSRIVTSFTITEDLMSPVLVLNIKIRDDINFFEDFKLTGEETIELEIEHISNDLAGKETIEQAPLDLKFSVKEYPNYEKSAVSPNVQEYTVVAVSEFAYISMLQRISRSVKGNPINEIRKIFKDNLNTESTFKGVCLSAFDGIMTLQSPLKAIEWLRSKAFDDKGAPFFVFSSISNKEIQIVSLSDLWSNKNKVFREYFYRQFLKATPNSAEAYLENSTRILDMKSNIQLDKLEQARSGGFASKSTSTDISTKTFTESTFKFPDDDSLSLGSPRPLFSRKRTFNIQGVLKILSELFDVSTTNLQTNSDANYQGNSNSAGPTQENISNAKSFYANMAAVSHHIMVYGDFRLNPGKKINVNIPKAINVKEYTEANEGSDQDGEKFDLALSGDYIISVVAHTFAGGMYVSKLKMIKNS
jgi:hypothetical protein